MISDMPLFPHVQELKSHLDQVQEHYKTTLKQLDSLKGHFFSTYLYVISLEPVCESSTYTDSYEPCFVSFLIV